MKGCLWIVAGLVAIVAVGAIAGSKGSSSTSTSPSPIDRPARDLAIIEFGASPSRAQIADFGVYLDTMQRRCTDERSRIADYTVLIQQSVAQTMGKTLKLRDIAGGVIRATARPLPPAGVTCNSVFADYLIIVTANGGNP